MCKPSHNTNNGPPPLPDNWADFLDFIKGEKNELKLFENHGPNSDKESGQGPNCCTQVHISRVITTTTPHPFFLPAIPLETTTSTQTIDTHPLHQITTTFSSYISSLSPFPHNQ
eukprot:TRINITY_DN8622_c0_g1_i8.p3 TRINITY_DN8622_c0_g1~~TRINITY_DN8622_c0_g1_i8.p3  ORF type:complete len:114 (-),score=14.49 TRINITY_DN8622_c0_g1_i8:775-1116(-)